MRQHEYATIGRVIETMYPDLLKGIVDIMEPQLTDTSSISKMYVSFCQGHNPDKEFNDKITFIAAVLKLYCPSALFLNCRATGRVCTVLTQVLGYNFLQSVSPFISQARVYIKNPAFKYNIDIVSQRLLEAI